jgi:nucleoside-diphosphate-sugar epimerase
MKLGFTMIIAALPPIGPRECEVPAEKLAWAKVVVLGTTGLVGGECVDMFRRNGIQVIAPTRETFSIECDRIVVAPGLREIMMNYPIVDAVHQSDMYNALENSFSDIFPAHLSYLLAGRGSELPYLQFSTGGVYGGSSELIRDDSPINPLTPYARMKLTAEENCRNTFPTHKILRLFFPYGLAQRRERLVSRLIQKIRQGEPIFCNEDGGPRVSIIDAKDVSQVVWEQLRSPWIGTRNLAGGESVRISELVMEIGKILQVKPLLQSNATSEMSLLAAPYDERNWESIKKSPVLRQMCLLQ